MHSDPLAYFITIRTRGTWLPGDERGSVDKERRSFGADFVRPHEGKRLAAIRSCADPPLILSSDMRAAVDTALRALFDFRGWKCWALNVRTNHVHFVISAPFDPERVMNDAKARATRALRNHPFVGPATKVWVRHGSTKYLWKDQDIADACQYVLECQ